MKTARCSSCSSASERADRQARVDHYRDRLKSFRRQREGDNQFPNLKLDTAVIKGHGKVSRKEVEKQGRWGEDVKFNYTLLCLCNRKGDE